MSSASYASYQQLAEALKARIESGDLKAAARMPSEQGLARELGVSRGLVQRAYGLLQQQGVLARRQGQRWRIVGAAETARSDVSYEDIAADLRSRLTGSPALDALPAGVDLAGEYGVSVDTVSEARRLLVQEGLVELVGRRYVRVGGGQVSRVAEVASVIREALEREPDEVAPDGRLIGERAWGERCRASKKTVQAALAQLEAEGVVSPAIPGKPRLLIAASAR